MGYAVVSQDALMWLWDKAKINQGEAQEVGHVRNLMALLERIKNPEGEFYGTRGLGLNWHECFVCQHKSDGAQADMAAFVADREAGERVVAMFKEAGATAHLDYRPSEPQWVQVKIGACKAHEANLKLLQATCGIDQRVTVARIRYALPS